MLSTRDDDMRRRNRASNSSASASPRRMRHPMMPSSDYPTYDRNLIQPSPNRTEAAAAMMHLFSSSASASTSVSPPHPVNEGEGLPGTVPTGGARPPIHTPKAKRKYVRKAARRPSAGGKTAVRATGNNKLEDDEDHEMSPASTSAQQEEDAESLPDAAEDSKFFPFREYNRKEKSLGLLCENFLKLYRSDQVSEICLDRAALQLGVERRRIYDIVNILESIHLVSRKSKNLYNWHGLGALPVSIAAMKKKYAEFQTPIEPHPTRNEFSIKGKDRRRGKSLSKLSQMFVQLFLKKEHCIIPLDQAAKQLIQMEDSEHEADRLLKTKIRRLYDVANVLVSVGLIEKLQLSNSRKPVFRWRNRSEDPEHAAALNLSPNQDTTADMDTASISSLPEAMETDTPRISMSSASDNSDDGSDSQSDVGAKRKQKQVAPPPLNDTGSIRLGASVKPKRVRTTSPTGTTRERAATKPKNLLQFDRNHLPIHPQAILQEQQLLVRRYMQQYIREYIEFIIRQQAQDESSSGAAAASTSASPTPSNNSTAVVDASLQEKVAAARRSLANEMDGTPVSLPTLINRVANELARSLNESVLWGTTTSPQSVADLFTLDSRAEKKLPDVLSTPSRGTNASSSATTSQPGAGKEIKQERDQEEEREEGEAEDDEDEEKPAARSSMSSSGSATESDGS